MIHIDKNGNVIGSFDAPQGHGMDVDSQGFVYIGQDTVRKYDPKTGKVVGEVPRAPEAQGGGGAEPGAARRARAGPWRRRPGRNFPGAGPRARCRSAAAQAAAAALAAFRQKYPPTTPMIVGQIEEIRLEEADNEMYVADSYLGGRVMVFDLDTFAFKRGWGAYGKPLSEISTNDADRAYTPGGPMPKEFSGHLTLNFSNDGLVYAADRNANRIHVTDKQGKFVQGVHPRAADRRGRLHRRRGVLARPAAAVPVHLGSDEQPASGSSTARTARSSARWAAWARTAASGSACT